MAAQLAAVIAMACVATSCKKEAREKKRPPDQPVTQTPFDTGYKTLTAASPRGDVITVLLRFDHLKEFGLEDEVDALVGILPDHRRVFGGGTKAGIPGTFDLVYVSTYDPALLIATTLAARALKPAEMQTMLAYPESGVTWGKAPGGPVGLMSATSWFSASDPRVYMMPRDPWIILARPDLLGALYDATNTVQPAWLEAVPGLARLGPPDNRPGKLIAAATASNLPERAMVPAVGAMTMPTRMVAAATAYDGVVTFTGDMTFAQSEHASIATDALATLRKRFEQFRPVRDLKVQRTGATVLWSTTASTQETAVLTGLAANLVRPMFPEIAREPPPVPPTAVFSGPKN